MSVTRTAGNVTETSGLYLVVLLDVLGQGDRLSRAPWPLPNGTDPLAAAQAYKSCLDEVSGLRSSVMSFYDGFSKDLRTSELGKVLRPRLRFQMFADTVIAYLPLSIDDSSIVGVLAALGACASAASIGLARAYAIRGGLDVGVGNETNGNEIYGPVAASAHRLESRVAEFPRIVVGRGLPLYLDIIKQSTPGYTPTQVSVHTVGLCRRLLAEDVDGSVIVDYLGEYWLESVRTAKETARKAYDYVSRQHQCFKKGNRKLALRYSLLLRYFESRARLWQTARSP